MKNEEIKLAKEQAYKEIKDAEEKLIHLRSNCKHEKTYLGEYMFRVGSIRMVEMCDYCGELMINK